MPPPQSLLQYMDGFDRPTLPYRSNSSVTDDSPHFIPGSQNVLATVQGNLQKRTGFSDPIELALSTIPGSIVRMFAWKRWAGSTTNPGDHYWMVCSVLGNTSKVWKLNVGVDASFSLIWTDSATANPFDFIDSNNFVFFGNDTTRTNMRKYDGTDCSLWGLDAPAAAPDISLVAGVLPAGLSFDTTTGVLSGTPLNPGQSTLSITATDAYGATSSQTYTLTIDGPQLAWVTPAGALPAAMQGVAYSQNVVVNGGTSPYTYSLFSGSLPAGLSISSAGLISGTPTSSTAAAFAIKAVDSAGIPATVTRGFSIFVSSPTASIAISPTSLVSTNQGDTYSQTLTATGTGPYVWALVSGALPPGIMFSSGVFSGSSSGAGNYDFIIRVTDSTGAHTENSYTIYVNPTAVTITSSSLPNPKQGVAYSYTIPVYGGASPLAGFTYTAGALVAQTGYYYGYTYTSVYGHESSMSDLSENTGIFTDQDVDIDVIASPDPQVNGINIYRTTDGGVADPAVMRLIVSLTNTIQSYVDSTEDQFLNVQTGPGLYLNDPPQPLRGFIWSNGRIWGFSKALSWFTGNEEITNGVAVECMSDAKNGNFYQWPSEVGGMCSTDKGVDIALSEEWWQISGDTLDTFRKSRLLKGGGMLSPTCVTVVGNSVFWVDTGKQIWSSDKGEIGQSIRPDLANLDQSQTFMCYHKYQTRNWLCILDGANGKLLIYDMDLEQWQIPWTVAATALASGLTNSTTISLLAAFAGHVQRLSLAAYNDDGATYDDQIRTGLMSIVPGSGTKARNATEVRQLEQVEMEVDSPANLPDWFYALADDDPKQLALNLWSDINDPIPLQFGAQASSDFPPTFLCARRWMANQAPQVGQGKNGVSAARRVAICAAWTGRTSGWTVDSMALAVRST